MRFRCILPIFVFLHHLLDHHLHRYAINIDILIFNAFFNCFSSLYHETTQMFLSQKAPKLDYLLSCLVSFNFAFTCKKQITPSCQLHSSTLSHRHNRGWNHHLLFPNVSHWMQRLCMTIRIEETCSFHLLFYDMDLKFARNKNFKNGVCQVLQLQDSVQWSGWT